MPQIFKPRSNAIFRAVILLLLLLLVFAGWFAYYYFRSSYSTGVNLVRQQPVQFSHAHHVGGLGIHCRNCHTSVEISSFAGMPPTETCMSCHSQIWTFAAMLEPVRASLAADTPLRWNRVHNLPDFVYFNHSIHVAKGIGCESCHGRVDRMPLMMQQNTLLMEWCLGCHRNPAQYVRPRDQIYTMGYQPPQGQDALGERLVREYRIRRLTDCYVCHR